MSHARRVVFKYLSREYIVVHLVELDMGDAVLQVVGEPGNAVYEWVLTRGGQPAEHSDCGYGSPTVALRDGLIAYHGLPELHGVAA